MTSSCATDDPWPLPLVSGVLHAGSGENPRMGALPQPPARGRRTESEQAPLMPKLKTFLVEDSPVIRFNLVAALEDLAPVEIVGFAESASEARHQLDAMLAANGCDLVIIDVFLKDGSGLDVLRQLGGQGARLRSVVLTNYATPEIRAECLQLGAARVFDKSRDIDALVSYCIDLAAA